MITKKIILALMFLILSASMFDCLSQPTTARDFINKIGNQPQVVNFKKLAAQERPIVFPMVLKGTPGLPRGIEIWNKTKNNIAIALGTLNSLPALDKLKNNILYPDMRYNPDLETKLSEAINNNMVIMLVAIDYKNEQNPGELRIYAFRPKKTLFVRFKQDGKKIILGPQTGPYKGWTLPWKERVTETGYPLKDNVQESDIYEHVFAGAR